METNVGDMDRMVRLALGAVLVLVSAAGVLGYAAMSTTVSALVGLVGIVLLATGYTRKCPVCDAMDVDTTGDSEGASQEPEDGGAAEEPETPEDWEEEPESRE